MDLYVLDKLFQKAEDGMVEDFSSVIWTERYSDAGDFELVVPATKKNAAKFPRGGYLWTPKSDEVMIIENRSAEKGEFTLSGPTLTHFLNNRIFRSTSDHSVRTAEYADRTPGKLMSDLVYATCIAGPWVDGTIDVGVDGPLNRIQDLIIDGYDNTPPIEKIAVPFGPLFDILKTIGQTYSIGFKLWLYGTNLASNYLRFTTYRGRDLTRDQTEHDVVQFSSALGSLNNIKEFDSIAGFKNAAYAVSTNNPPGTVAFTAAAYAYDTTMIDPDGPGGLPPFPATPFPVDFDRRSIMVEVSDLNLESVAGDANLLKAYLQQRAKDALANNNFVKLLDGEVLPQKDYEFDRDYRLGDIIELVGNLDETPQKARVTEYIRSQDATGERSYPTVSVLD